jgi:hypothetical protein
MPITDFLTYGELVYSLQDRYPCVRRSTLVLATVGSTLAKLEGQIAFSGNIVLEVWELVDFDAGCILDYSYEVYQGGTQVLWYDPFEHPHIPELASTHPHHKHAPPDIKHHRLPAPGISFTEPNLSFLIQEIERTFLA